MSTSSKKIEFAEKMQMLKNDEPMLDFRLANLVIQVQIDKNCVEQLLEVVDKSMILVNDHITKAK